MAYSRDDICQDRSESCEVDRIGLWPNNLVREDPFAVVFINIKVVRGVKRLTIDNRRLDLVTEKILDLRSRSAGWNRRRYGVHILDDVNERLSARWLCFRDLFDSISNRVSTIVVVIEDDHRMLESWCLKAVGFFIVRRHELREITVTTFRQTKKTCRARFRILIKPYLQADIPSLRHFRQIRELGCQASDRMC